MVKKNFCDRCGKDIATQLDNFEEVFENMNSLFFDKDKNQLLKPQLCKKCDKGYKKIVEGFNKVIKNYLGK